MVLYQHQDVFLKLFTIVYNDKTDITKTYGQYNRSHQPPTLSLQKDKKYEQRIVKIHPLWYRHKMCRFKPYVEGPST